MEEEFFLTSESEMEEFSARISKEIRPGDIIFLHGNLGAGKTTFTRGLLRALGFEGRVKSPTFTLVEPYDLTESQGFVLNHYDLYRLDPEALDLFEALENLGLRDQMNQKYVLIIEWPDRLSQLGKIIQPNIEIFIDFSGEQGRKLRLSKLTC